MCVWDTNDHQPIIIDGFFVDWGKEISPEVTALNGVSQEYVREYGLFQGYALDRILKLMQRVEFVVAHNGTLFDKLFFDSWCKRIFDHTVMDQMLWVDSRDDIDYPKEIKTRNLVHLAAEHGFLNPFAHRAVFDVLTMLVIVDKYDWEKTIFSAKQPTIVVQALVSYDNRQDAKDAQFYWDGERKQWRRSMKQHKYKPNEFKFKTRIVR